MSFQLWLAFAATSAVLLLIPGPTVLTVIGYAMSHGRRASATLFAAVALGDSTALAVSLIGLGSLLAASSFWFTAVKGVGGLYLLYLGIRRLRASRAPAGSMPSVSVGSRWHLFANTWLVTALNPKGIVFFAAFLPQFINPNADVKAQLWILATTFVAMATLSSTLYVVFAGAARSLWSSPLVQRRFNLGGGLLLSGAGVWALMARRPA